MRLSLLFSTFATIAVAAILPSNEFELGGRPLKPRTLAGAKNLFNRQDTCATDKICGNLCCYSEYYCSPEVTCQLIGTCGTDQVCGSRCCYSGYYCATDLNCYPIAAATTAATSEPTSAPSSDTCSSSETLCGTSCCNNLDQTCDYYSNTCSDKPHKPKTSTSTSDESKKLPGKVIGGLVVGVLAAIGAIGAVVLWLFGCCFGKKKKAADGAEEQPPAYAGDIKVPETQVHEVSPESK